MARESTPHYLIVANHYGGRTGRVLISGTSWPAVDFHLHHLTVRNSGV